ncbi:MAG: hypothetical protein WBQ72_15665 [Terriglobales bacterium]
MPKRSGILRSFCLAAALASTLLGTACIHRTPRYYDSYYNDYHKWNDREMDYYDRWCRETHRDPRIDFAKLHADEQDQYFKWRHDQDKAHYKQPH